MNKNPSSDSRRDRPVRSYVLRTGRMTEGQEQALEQVWPRMGLEHQQGLCDFSHIFARDNAPVVFEIGFGMGDSLIEMAKAEPEKNFIGVEVHTPGVGRILASAEREGLENLRVYCHDAVEIIQDCIPDNSLDRIQVYFPDPWHKKKHHKRRIIQSEFVQKLRGKLKLGGVLHLATDWEHYADWMMEVMAAAEGYQNYASQYCFSERPDYRPVTKFERRGERLGHGVWDLLFERTE